MGTLTIDIESLGITLTKGVTYTIEIDENFVKADGSGRANAESVLVSFVAEGPEPTATTYNDGNQIATTTWNVKLSALGDGADTETYFVTDYIAANYFTDAPIATLYNQDSTLVGSYNITNLVAPNQVEFTIPIGDLRADDSYFVYFESDVVVDTVGLSNDAVLEDTFTTFTTRSEADGFPSLTSSQSAAASVQADVNYIADFTSTMSTSASCSATAKGLVISDPITLSTTVSSSVSGVKTVGLIDTLSSSFSSSCSGQRFRDPQPALSASFTATATGWWAPADTHIVFNTTAAGTRTFAMNMNNYGPGTTTIYWGDGSQSTGAGSNIHTYSTDGEYNIRVEGTVQYIDCEATGPGPDEVYIGKDLLGFKMGPRITWAGDVLGASVETMEEMFYNSTTFNQDISYWDTSNVTDMSWCFADARDFNQNIGSWDTSSVTTMEYMFYNADDFNQDIDGWDVSNVTDFGNMFRQAQNFNQSLNSWNTSSVDFMTYMFRDATSMNSAIGNWDTSGVADMTGMFSGASNFDQDISNWCVSQFSSKPSIFDSGTPSSWTTAEKPQWGDPC